MEQVQHIRQTLNLGRSILLISILLLILSACNPNKSNRAPTTGASEHDMSSMEGTDMSHAAAEIEDSIMLQSLTVPPNFEVVSSQQSVKPSVAKVASSIKARGYVSPDERRNNKISSRISGRIEKLFVKYELQYLKAGAKVMEIYSPELNNYQEELLYLIKNHPDESMIDKAEEKLRLLGITQSQINDIKRGDSTFYTITVRSPQSGYVFFKPMESPVALSETTKENDAMNRMGNSKKSNIASSEVAEVREGDYINKGDLLFWLNDLQIVWAMISVDNSHLHEIKIGTKISLVGEQFQNDTINASINFIEPTYQSDQKFGTARIYLNNSNHRYKINSLLEAEINPQEESVVMIPYSSVLFLGKRKFVWVLTGFTPGKNRIYQAREITVGTTEGNWIEIKHGLNATEEIALNAGYLLDRESLITPDE